MGVFSKIEGGLDSAFDKAAGTVFRGPLEPAQIAKRAEKQMNREKLVGAGKQYAPTLYTVLVNRSDDNKLYAFYPTMAAEIETYLMSKGSQSGLKFDGRPLVRFIVDKKLKSGKFEIIAENVAAPIISKLRDEEAEYYGLKTPEPHRGVRASLSPDNLRAENNLFALPESHPDDLFINTGGGENAYSRTPRSSVSMEYPGGFEGVGFGGEGFGAEAEMGFASASGAFDGGFDRAGFAGAGSSVLDGSAMAELAGNAAMGGAVASGAAAGAAGAAGAAAGFQAAIGAGVAMGAAGTGAAMGGAAAGGVAGSAYEPELSPYAYNRSAADRVLNAALDSADFANARSNALDAADFARARLNLATVPTTSASAQVIGHARLTNINAGKQYALTRTVLIIGRDESCAITIRDANISRHHAQLTQDATGVWKLTDLGSTNGSSLNGSNVKTAFLRDGDELTFGITTLVFRES